MNMNAKRKGKGEIANEAVQWMVKHPRKVAKMTLSDIAETKQLNRSTLACAVYRAMDNGVDVPRTIGSGQGFEFDVEFLLLSNKEARKWTRQGIAKHLGCTPSTVIRQLLDLHRAGSKLVKYFRFSRKTRIV